MLRYTNDVSLSLNSYNHYLVFRLQEMAKAKAPKLRIPLLHSIKFCCPKEPSSMVITSPPLPISTIIDNYFSPFTSQSYRFSIPAFPDPPSTPDNIPRTKHNSSKIVPDGHIGGPSNPHMNHGMETELLLDHGYYSRMRKSGKGNVPSRIEKKREKLTTIRPNVVIEEEPCMNRIGSGTKPRRLRDRVITMSMTDKGVKEESFVVVKRSEDPYEDFKKSMVQMIVEKGLFEPRELENLLMKFLSINSRLHHRAILQAFTEIFKELFN